MMPRSDEAVTIRRGEALAALRELPDSIADAVITDPPYCSGGFTRGDRTARTATKYVRTGVASP
jgi:site-specific DNA-methyltransferase (adenine-specific)